MQGRFGSSSSYATRDYRDDTVIPLIVNNPHYADDRERASEVIVFLIAGHNTTSYSLSWVLKELARHPHEAAKLKSALCNVPREERSRHPELKIVLRDGMRLKPVAAAGRIGCTAKNVLVRPRAPLLDDDDDKDAHLWDQSSSSPPPVLIPKGSIVYLPRSLLNHNPSVYLFPGRLPSRPMALTHQRHAFSAHALRPGKEELRWTEPGWHGVTSFGPGEAVNRV